MVGVTAMMQFVRHRHGAYTSQQPPLFLQQNKRKPQSQEYRGSSDNESDGESSGIGTRRLKNNPQAKMPKQQHACAKDLAAQFKAIGRQPRPFLSLVDKTRNSTGWFWYRKDPSPSPESLVSSCYFSAFGGSSSRGCGMSGPRRSA